MGHGRLSVLTPIKYRCILKENVGILDKAKKLIIKNITQSSLQNLADEGDAEALREKKTGKNDAHFFLEACFRRALNP